MTSSEVRAIHCECPAVALYWICVHLYWASLILEKYCSPLLHSNSDYTYVGWVTEPWLLGIPHYAEHSRNRGCPASCLWNLEAVFLYRKDALAPTFLCSFHNLWFHRVWLLNCIQEPRFTPWGWCFTNNWEQYVPQNVISRAFHRTFQPILSLM